jgi:hypothetical protein
LPRKPVADYSPPHRPKAIRFGDLSIGCKALRFLVDAIAHLQSCFYGGCAREAFGSAGFSDTGSPTCVQLPPYRLATSEWRSIAALIGASKMNRYIPLTGIDLIPASLVIDSQAPLDVLQAMADYRIRTVTQVLENIAFRNEMESDSVVLSDFAQLLAIPLRDGCDLMDVIGQRLRSEVCETEETPAS